MAVFPFKTSFDEQPIPELNSEAIDFQTASELFKPIRKLARHELHTLKILTGYQGRTVPTVGGILLFGVDRQACYPDAWVQVGRFAGSDKHCIIDSAKIRTYLPEAAAEVIAFLQKHMIREAVIGWHAIIYLSYNPAKRFSRQRYLDGA